MSDEKCMSRRQVDTLKREFMALLQNQVVQPDDGEAEIPSMLIAAK